MIDIKSLSLEEKKAYLAKLMKQKKEKAGPKRAPVSFTQQRLWLLDTLEPGNPAYHMTVALRLSGRLDRDALEKTLNEIVRRHESLRTTFEAKDGDPSQVIHPPTPCDLPYYEIERVPEAAFRRQVQAEARRPFDLARGPLIRASLFRRAGDEHLLLVVMHHIISDGWSVGVLIREFTTLYAAFAAGEPSPLEDLPIQYADYAAWQRQQLAGERFDRLKGYWKKQLAGLTTLEFPTDYPRPPVQGFAGARHSVDLPESLGAALDTLARKEHSTLFMTYMSAFATLLHRYSGQDDVVVGSPIANRTRSETEGLIGFFANTLVLRCDLSGDPSFRELLARVRKTSLEAFDHQEMPFESLVEELNPPRDPSRNPLFQVSMTMQNTPREQAKLPGLTMSRAEREEETAKFDLSLSILRAKSSAPRLVLEYSTDLFKPETAKRILEHLRRLLEGVVANPDAKLSDLPMLGDAETRKLLVDWNATAADYPKDACFHHLFEAQAAKTPDAIAVECEDRRWTYKELNERANQVAHHLRGLGVQAETLVGICVERSLEMMAGLLGIMKAGGAYLPLDPVFPHERLTFMLADAEAPVLLTQRRLLKNLPDYKGQVVCLDPDSEELARESKKNPKNRSKPTDLAYVIYTSGSTGKPKGVQLEHRPLVNFLESMRREPGMTADDTLLAVTTLSFDIAGLELYLPLLVGGRVVIAGRDDVRDGAALLVLLETSKATVMQATPATWRLLLQMDEKRERLAIKKLCGGEALPRDLADQLLECGGELWNLYGPTETTIWSTVAKVEQAEGPVSIGRPIANTQVYVLDAQRKPVPVGATGELSIGGDGVARGYLKRPELTAERFLDDPFANPKSEIRNPKLYRTGDVARWRQDGTLEVLGRIDNQVKLRGFRVELGEIEAVLQRFPGVRESVVVVREDTPGDKRLAAYVVPDQQPGPSGADLRDHLKQELPEYMVPTAYMVLEALPRLPNGKLDRKSLPAPDHDRAGTSRAFVAPRNPTEEKLAAIWGEVLKLERVGVEDNFFDLGGHSLLGARVVNRATAVFEVTVPLRMLFQKPNVAELAEWIDEVRKEENIRKVLPLKPMPREGDLPLSYNQEALWFLEQLDPGKATYLITQAARMRGNLEVPLLEKALEETLRRHETLRTSFTISNGKPVQVIHPPGPFHIPVTDLSHLPEEERLKQGYELVMANRREPFDLSVFPLFRVKIVQLAPQDCLLLISVHHIVFDGWSVAILAREIVGHYQALKTGKPPQVPELPVQYADYVLWQRQYMQGELLDNLLGYWKGQLATQTPLDLPTDYPRPRVRTANGANARVRFSTDLTAAIHRFCRQQGATPFMTLLAAFQAILHHYCRQQQYVCVGSPVANRTRVETENLVGYFINMLLLNTDLGGDPTFAELLSRVRKTTLDAIEHQEIPLGLLATEENTDRDLSRHPRIDVMFVLQNNEVPTGRLPGIMMSSARRGYKNAGAVEKNERGGAHAKFDLSMVLSERRGQIRGGLNYNSDLFREETAERLIRHFRNLVQVAITHPQLRLSQLSILDEDERNWVLSRWQQKSLAASRYLHQLVEDHAEKTPTSVAVVSGDQQITYAELNRGANQLAHYLRKQGVGPEKTVGICVEKSIDMVVAVLGVLKAGGAYVPLNPEHAPDRLKYILSTAGSVHLLTQQKLREKIGDLGVPTLSLDGNTLKSESDHNPNVAVNGNTLAYIIFTSGSTGEPKGVMVEHASLLNAYHGWEHDYKLDNTQTHLQMANFSFDVCTGDLTRALGSGAKLVLCPRETLLEPAKLHDLIVRAKVDTAEFVPVVLRSLMRHVEESGKKLDNFRLLIVGSDAWYVKEHEALQKLVGERTRVVNSYGLTEATIDSTYFEGDVSELPRDAVVPIGRAFPNNRIYILDKHLQPVPIGVPGELHIGGPGLARGYVGRPDLSAERFIKSPFAEGERLYKTGDLAKWQPSGLVEFLGRTDYQVKVRGFRVEPGEIEVVLKQHPRLKEAAVVPRNDGPGGETRLVGYVVANDDQPLTVPELRSYLIKKLPDYMVPTVFVPMPALPMTPTGKVDRQALPSPEGGMALTGVGYAAPRNEVEAKLCAILADVLKVEKVGVHDNFFEMGGHSLLAVQVISRIRDEFANELPMVAIFTAPTVAGLAEKIAVARGELSEEKQDDDLLSRRQRDVPEVQRPLVPLQPHGQRPNLYLVHGLAGQAYGLSQLAKALGLDQPTYALQSRGLFDQVAPDTRIEEMAKRYVAAIRSKQPQGPYLIGGISMGGLVAMEMGRQLAEAGEPPLLVALLDTILPTKRAKARWERLLGMKDEEVLLMALNRMGLRRMLEREDPDKLPRVLAHLGLRMEIPKELAPEKRWEFFKARVLENLHDASPGGDLTDLQSLVRTHRAHMQAQLHYEPRPYAHPVLLLKAEKAGRKKGVKRFVPFSSTAKKAKIKALRKLYPNVTIDTTPGTHFGMLRGENLKVLAGKLTQHLADAIKRA